MNRAIPAVMLGTLMSATFVGSAGANSELTLAGPTQVGCISAPSGTLAIGSAEFSVSTRRAHRSSAPTTTLYISVDARVPSSAQNASLDPSGAFTLGLVETSALPNGGCAISAVTNGHVGRHGRFDVSGSIDVQNAGDQFQIIVCPIWNESLQGGPVQPVVLPDEALEVASFGTQFVALQNTRRR